MKRFWRGQARRRFSKLVTIERSDGESRGTIDPVLVKVDRADACGEIRGCGAELGEYGYIPHVSVIDYCCLVIWAGNRDSWYGFSRDVLVRLAAAKRKSSDRTNRFRPDAVPRWWRSQRISRDTHVRTPGYTLEPVGSSPLLRQRAQTRPFFGFIGRGDVGYRLWSARIAVQGSHTSIDTSISVGDVKAESSTSISAAIPKCGAGSDLPPVTDESRRR